MENLETKYMQQQDANEILQSIEHYTASEPIISMAPIIIKTLQGTGIINITSLPSGADVYLNGDIYGKTPITITDIEPGDHTYMLKLLGYTDYVSKIDVKVGELCCRTVDLQYSGSAGTCVVAPTIPNGEIPTIPTVRLDIILYIALGIIIGSLLYSRRSQI